MNKPLPSNLAFLCCALFVVAVTLAKPRYLEQHTNATLAWDVSGYYLYLPALFIYNDLYQLGFLPGIIEKYIPSPTADQAYRAANGNMVMKYSAGMALQYAPAFFAAHSLAGTLGYPADGFSLPYQAFVHWSSVLYALLGLFFLKKCLNRYFPEKTTAWALVCLVGGTNWLNYATFDAANTHAYLFTLVAMLLWGTIRFYETFYWKYALLIGACLGLAALTRPTEIIYALIPLCWGIASVPTVRERWAVLAKHWPKMASAVLLTGGIGLIQLVYWKCASGHWLQYSYQDQGFSFLRPHFADVFFSYRKGWLLYTPIMLLALVGFCFFWKQHKPLFPVVLVFFLVNTWIISAWDIWWYGGAFGQRAFIQSYPLLAFPLAALLQASMRAPAPAKALVAAFALACCSLNIFQTYQAHWGPFETEAMTRAYYWRVFGKTKNDPYDRLLLDAKEGFSGEKKQVETIVNEGFESLTDTLRLGNKYARSGKWSSYVDISQEFSPPINIPRSPQLNHPRWLHVEAWFYSQKMNWDYWPMPQLVVRFEQKEVPVKEHIIRPFRVMAPGHWASAWMDVPVPAKDFDNIEIFLWNPGGLDVELYMDDMVVEVFSDR